MAADVRVVGAVEDPMPYLSDADLYLFSSRTESFGLGVLEAMACGVPVVGPQVGGVNEVLGDPPAGRLVPASNPWALAEAAHDILTDAALWEELSARGRQRACATFGAERVVSRYLEAYRRAYRRESARAPGHARRAE